MHKSASKLVLSLLNNANCNLNVRKSFPDQKKYIIKFFYFQNDISLNIVFLL